jgi:phosphoribosylaminoimidazolecarboxamide formyltransferase/IMP cyclohydrolase
MEDMVKIKRALLSVSDKSGLIELGKKLDSLNVEIISTGGTMAALRDADIRALSIQTFTGAPEILGGRVKTLHPKVHAGILFRRDDEEHAAEMSHQEYKQIDLVVVNLYPFEQTLVNPKANHKDKIENIDIGGPTMIRASAKNYEGVAVVTDPADYPAIIDEIENNEGCLSMATRKELAGKAFALTARYDTAISGYFTNLLSGDSTAKNNNDLDL